MLFPYNTPTNDCLPFPIPESLLFSFLREQASSSAEVEERWLLGEWNLEGGLGQRYAKPTGDLLGFSQTFRLTSLPYATPGLAAQRRRQDAQLGRRTASGISSESLQQMAWQFTQPPRSWPHPRPQLQGQEVSPHQEVQESLWLKRFMPDGRRYLLEEFYRHSFSSPCKRYRGYRSHHRQGAPESHAVRMWCIRGHFCHKKYYLMTWLTYLWYQLPEQQS